MDADCSNKSNQEMEQRSEVLQRYSRQMILPCIGNNGQNLLNSSRVLLIGAGGIGSTAALFLASSGIPITILDHDFVDRSNLHRQVIHSEESQGVNKAKSAIQRLNTINSSLKYRCIEEKLTCDNAFDIISEHDIVIDATDNFEARYIINDACVLLKKPFISGSAVGMEGQITVIVPGVSPCYRCLYPQPSIAEMCRSCANAGVLGPVPGIIGSMEAVEAIKLITMNGSYNSSSLTSLVGRQLLYDAANGECFNFDLPPRRSDCISCGAQATIRSLTDTFKFLEDCKTAAETASMCYLGSIDNINKISTRDYHEKVFKNETIRHVVIDVRNSVQFALSSFSIYAGRTKLLQSFNELKNYLEHSDKSPETILLLHIPLSSLERELSNVESKDNTIKDLNYILNSSIIEGMFVLCRRGIDSTVATRLLHSNINDAANLHRLRNIEGGLTSWKTDGDTNFPMY